MRKDAQARRDRLIAAAAEMFAAQGYDVALELIAERAGVGRGTLYRNFVDRNAMIVAVLEARIDELARFIDANFDSPTLFQEFAQRQGVVAAFHTDALVGSESGSLEAIVVTLRTRVDALLETVIRRAVALGSIAREITVADMRIVNRMLIAAATMPGIERHDAVERALAIVMTGLSPDRSANRHPPGPDLPVAAATEC